MSNQYFQCRLRRLEQEASSISSDLDPGVDDVYTETTGWIEACAAKAGATVELLPSHEMWTVAEVFNHGLPETFSRSSTADLQ